MDPDGRVGRVMQRISSTRRFSKIAPHVLPRLDKVLYRVSRGRFMLGSALTPSVILTTTGAKSGIARETPLTVFDAGDDAFIAVGSNYGRESHPAWTYNLLAHPAATVSYKGRDINVKARLLEGAERDEAWKKVTSVFRNYDVYQQRVSREIRLFLLQPV